MTHDRASHTGRSLFASPLQTAAAEAAIAGGVDDPFRRYDQQIE
jgi:hypothetical protein